MKNIAFSAVIISISLLTGCATIANGRFQQVTVQTQPPGANCTLSNDKGQWQVNSTPASVQVHRSMNDLKIACERPGYKTTTDSIASSVKKMMVGNAVFGGVVGAGIDTVNGAGFSYPNIINVNMQSEDGYMKKAPTAAGKKASK